MMEGTCKKLPNIPENLLKLAQETRNLKRECAEIVKHLDKFDFEDRKNVQLLMTELYNNFPDVMEETLDFEKEAVVRTLVDTYT